MATIIHTVKLVADAKSATDELQKFGNQIVGVERTVASFERSMSGTRQIKAANEWTAALAKLGGATKDLSTSEHILAGASKLTTAEKVKLNRTVTEAIEKYRLLGKTAPTAMLEVQKATQVAEKTTSGFGTVIGKFGPMLAATFSVGAVMRFGQAVMENADELVRLSDKTGITIEGIQELQYAAGQAGIELETVTSAVSMMQKRLAGGEDSALSALRGVGLSFKDFKDLAPDEQFRAIAQEVAKVEDPMQRVRLATDLFGRSGAEVLPLLIADVEALAAAAPKMSAAAVQAFDRFGDASSAAMARLSASVSEFFVGRALADIYEGIDNIKALVREDGSIDWGVAAGGTGGLAPRVRPTTLWKPAVAPGLDTDPASDRAVAKLERLSEALIKAAKPLELLKAHAYAFDQSIEVVKDGVVDLADQLEFFHSTLIKGTTTFEDQIDILPDYNALLDETHERTEALRQSTEGATEASTDWQGVLRSLGASFRQLAQTSGSSGLGAVAGQLANVVGGMELGLKGGNGLNATFKLMDESSMKTSAKMVGLAASVMQVAAAMEQATQSTSKWTNAASGAATGASIGASFGVYGAIVGGIAGAIYGYTKNNPQDDVTQGMKDQWLSQYGGASGLMSLLSLAGDGLDDYHVAMAAGEDDLLAFNQAVKNVAVSLEKYGKDLSAYGEAANGTLTLAAGVDLSTTQEQFARIGVYAGVIFGNILLATGSLAKAFDAIGPTLDAMIKGRDTYGLVTTGVMNEMLGIYEFLKNNPSLNARVTGLGQIGSALGANNAALLSSSGLMPTFGADIVETFDQLQAAGMSREQSWMLLQAPMQALYQSLSKVDATGIPLYMNDPAMLKLWEFLTPALQQGFVGEGLRPIAEQQLNVLTDIRALLVAANPSLKVLPWSLSQYNPLLDPTGTGWGVPPTVPPTTPTPTPGPVLWPETPPVYDPSYKWPGWAHGTNGFEWFGGGTPAMLHGWERVDRLSDMAGRDVGSYGGGPSAPIVIDNKIYMDGREVARNQVRHHPAAVRRYGVH